MTEIKAKPKSPTEAKEMRVVVSERGPYLYYGVAPFAQQFIIPDKMGESWNYQRGREYDTTGSDEQPTALCRCGHSKCKPYCDGTHQTTEWDSELTASMDRLLEEADFIEGEELLLSDNTKYCSYARFCHPAGGAWRLTKNSDNDEARELAIREASMCPSARLMAWGRDAESPYEFDIEPSLSLLEDPAIGCSGGIWLRGGVVVERESGERYELRNRVVLCRCGGSHNKPYCDGSHAAQEWQDDITGEGKGELFPDGELVVG